MPFGRKVKILNCKIQALTWEFLFAQSHSLTKAANIDYTTIDYALSFFVDVKMNPISSTKLKYSKKNLKKKKKVAQSGLPAAVKIITTGNGVHVGPAIWLSQLTIIRTYVRYGTYSRTIY